MLAYACVEEHGYRITRKRVHRRVDADDGAAAAEVVVMRTQVVHPHPRTCTPRLFLRARPAQAFDPPVIVYMHEISTTRRPNGPTHPQTQMRRGVLIWTACVALSHRRRERRWRRRERGRGEGRPCNTHIHRRPLREADGPSLPFLSTAVRTRTTTITTAHQHTRECIPSCMPHSHMSIRLPKCSGSCGSTAAFDVAVALSRGSVV